ncbi:hypothetical protein JCM5296_002167 [Sporobolomyces johnsonii]
MSSGVTATPGTDRRYTSTASPSRGESRLSRGAKVALIVIALAVALVVIVPPAVVETRKNNKNNAAEDNLNGFTTVVDGLTTFIQTKTADIITRSSLSTLANGQVKTVTSEVTLPLVTVSQTSINAIQTGVITTTISGEVVVLATRTSYVAGEGQAAVVTQTASGGESLLLPHPGLSQTAAETIVQTVYDVVTVIGTFVCGSFASIESRILNGFLMQRRCEHLLARFELRLNSRIQQLRVADECDADDHFCHSGLVNNGIVFVAGELFHPSAVVRVDLVEPAGDLFLCDDVELGYIIGLAFGSDFNPSGYHVQLLCKRHDSTHQLDFGFRDVNRFLVFVLPDLHSRTSRILGRLPDHDAELNHFRRPFYDSLNVVDVELDRRLYRRLQLPDVKRFSACQQLGQLNVLSLDPKSFADRVVLDSLNGEPLPNCDLHEPSLFPRPARVSRRLSQQQLHRTLRNNALDVGSLPDHNFHGPDLPPGPIGALDLNYRRTILSEPDEPSVDLYSGPSDVFGRMPNFVVDRVFFNSAFQLLFVDKFFRCRVLNLFFRVLHPGLARTRRMRFIHVHRHFCYLYSPTAVDHFRLDQPHNYLQLNEHSRCDHSHNADLASGSSSTPPFGSSSAGSSTATEPSSSASPTESITFSLSNFGSSATTSSTDSRGSSTSSSSSSESLAQPTTTSAQSSSTGGVDTTSSSSSSGAETSQELSTSSSASSESTEQPITPTSAQQTSGEAAPTTTQAQTTTQEASTTTQAQETTSSQAQSSSSAAGGSSGGDGEEGGGGSSSEGGGDEAESTSPASIASIASTSDSAPSSSFTDHVKFKLKKRFLPRSQPRRLDMRA